MTMGGNDKTALTMLSDEQEEGEMFMVSESHCRKIGNMSVALPALRRWASYLISMKLICKMGVTGMSLTL